MSSETDPGREPASRGLWRPDEGTAAEASPRDVHGSRKARRPRRVLLTRRSRLFIWGTVVLLVLAADAVFVATRVAADLQAAAAALEEARTTFDAGNIRRTKALVNEALDRSRAALSLRGHPAYLIGSAFADVDAVTSVALASEDVSLAGVEAVDAAQELGLTGERGIASTVYEDGRVRFEAMEAAEPRVAAADRRLAAAAGHLADAPEATFGIVRDAVDEARDEVERARDSARKGSVLLEALPSLLGRGEPRTYLLALQALGEARATGGVIGFYGILDAVDGNVRLRHAGPIHELRRTASSPPVPAPRWFEASYGPQFALRQALQVNVSPRTTVVADVLLEMYEASRGERLDGVLFMDPITLQSLLRSTGPIEVPGFEQPIGPDNAADVLLRQSYVELADPREQNRYLGEVIREFWGRVSRGDFDGSALATAVADEVARGHLLVYSRDDSDRRALAQLEADGDFTTAGPSVQMVFNNNYAVNKVDYFLHREIRTRVDLTFEGDARVRTEVTLRNEAPAGPPSPLLGPPPGRDDPPGFNRMVLGFLLPKEAQAHQLFARAGADPGEPFVYDDSGYPVAWSVVELPAGTERTVTLTYFVPNALEGGPDGGAMRLTLWPQPRVNADGYEVVVSPPEGFVVAAAGEDVSATEARRLTFEGVLEEEREIVFRMHRDEAA